MSVKAITLELQQASIVVLGNINPVIFQPAWFRANQLISKEDEEDTELKIVSPPISAMFIGKWLNVEVQEDKFMSICNDPQHFKPMRDFVQGVFMLLEHTPVRAVGINFMKIFSLRDTDNYKELIEKLYNRETLSTIIEEPTFRNIDITRGSNKEDMLLISIAPYPRIEFGIQVRFNFHREPSDFTPLKLVNMLSEEWENKFKESILISDKIVGG